MAISMYKSGFSYDGHRVITCDALTATGLCRHGFSTRKGGVSSGKFSLLNLGVATADDRENVTQNFALFCNDVGIDPGHLVMAKQIHSTRVLTAKKKDAGRNLAAFDSFEEADGFVTNEPGVCLTSFSADCTPILFLDPVKRVVASVHSGWRGTLGQIACQGIDAMQKQYGSQSKDILVAMGPSIKQCHFEVGEEVYRLFSEKFGDVARDNTLQKGNKYYIDTDAINVHSLMSMGILKEHIFCHPDCTFCDSETFFSYRRDGETGRMCAMIELI